MVMGIVFGTDTIKKIRPLTLVMYAQLGIEAKKVESRQFPSKVANNGIKHYKEQLLFAEDVILREGALRR